MENLGLAGASPSRPPGGVEAGLERDIQAHLGRQLRALYDEVANEPVPDRFRALLDELERKESTAGTKGSSKPKDEA